MRITLQVESLKFSAADRSLIEMTAALLSDSLQLLPAVSVAGGGAPMPMDAQSKSVMSERIALFRTPCE